MKHGERMLICSLAGLALCITGNAVGGDSPGNPYQGIIDRNVFGLKPPPPPPDPESTKPPPPKVFLTGITTILGNRRALLKMTPPAKPGEPAKEQSFTLGEGQREETSRSWRSTRKRAPSRSTITAPSQPSISIRMASRWSASLPRSRARGAGPLGLCRRRARIHPCLPGTPVTCPGLCAFPSRGVPRSHPLLPQVITPLPEVLPCPPSVPLHPLFPNLSKMLLRS